MTETLLDVCMWVLMLLFLRLQWKWLVQHMVVLPQLKKLECQEYCNEWALDTPATRLDVTVNLRR